MCISLLFLKTNAKFTPVGTLFFPDNYKLFNPILSNHTQQGCNQVSVCFLTIQLSFTVVCGHIMEIESYAAEP